MVQWLRLHAPNAGDPGSISSQGTRSQIPQLKDLCAATKTRHSRINKSTFFFFFKEILNSAPVLLSPPAT